MSPLDLDALEARRHPGHAITIARVLPDGEIRDGTCVIVSGRQVKDDIVQVWLRDLPALLAELRAARDCVDALRTIVSDDRTYYAQLHHQHYAEQTLELYDKAAGAVR